MLNQAASTAMRWGSYRSSHRLRRPRISIPNVTTAENNIHAGVKVLKAIADKYFSDPEIDAEDRLLFTFAAYNAGPNRIADLREHAAARGLDPNKSFGNIELLVSQDVEQTAVRYVSNIYKYCSTGVSLSRPD